MSDSSSVHARYICFDLDGTLMNPELGITRCLAHAFKELGRPVPELPELRRHVGRPLHLIFRDMLATDDQLLIEQAIFSYRDRFGRIGLFENEIYAGIETLLLELNAAERTCAVVTLKARIYSERIIEHLGLKRFFAGIFGPELDERLADKERLLRRAADELTAPAAKLVMVGDRREDICAAKALGASAIGVAYGFGCREELEESGADLIVNNVPELAAALGANQAF